MANSASWFCWCGLDGDHVAVVIALLEKFFVGSAGDDRSAFDNDDEIRVTDGA